MGPCPRPASGGRWMYDVRRKRWAAGTGEVKRGRCDRQTHRRQDGLTGDRQATPFRRTPTSYARAARRSAARRGSADGRRAGDPRRLQAVEILGSVTVVASDKWERSPRAGCPSSGAVTSGGPPARQDSCTTNRFGSPPHTRSLAVDETLATAEASACLHRGDAAAGLAGGISDPVLAERTTILQFVPLVQIMARAVSLSVPAARGRWRGPRCPG